MSKGYAIPMSSRFMENSRFGKHTPTVWREANGSIREPIPPLLEFRHVIHHHDEKETIGGVYQVKDGPTFTARRIAPMWERRAHGTTAFESAGEVLLDIRDQVRAYNAAILPIDNGPEVLVYLAETCTRVAAAVASARDGKPDTEELIASCRANTYAGHEAVAFFNQSTTPERT